MGLLIHPVKDWDEGPSGYRHRLASANFLEVRDLISLEIIGELEGIPALHDISEPGAGHFDPWVRRFSRFCPVCLETRQTWLVGWELLYADACSICGNWLVDSCGACGRDLNWHRAQINKCDFGHFLTSEASSLAPQAVVKLRIKQLLFCKFPKSSFGVW
jgi:hypothetical protein